jgi:hypothetical protein
MNITWLGSIRLSISNTQIQKIDLIDMEAIPGFV